MTIENTSGLGVNNQYGPRDIQEGVLGGGELPTSGAMHEAVIYARGKDLNNAGLAFDTNKTLPAGAKFIEAYAEVTEAFVLGGTTPTINVGTSTSAGTNFAIELAEAEGEAIGEVYNATGAGTFAAPLAADTLIAVELDGTTPTVTDAGELKVVIRYLKV
jgi:hypothetical protein